MKRNKSDISNIKAYNPDMRIGIDCRLPTYQMGGISQSILNLIPALAKIDKEYDYILYHSRKERRSFVPQSAGKFRRQELWTPCHHRFEKWALAAELVRDQLDVFHSPDFIPPVGGAGRRIITIHDLNFLYFPQFLTTESKRYYLDQIDWAARSADHIVADSYATRNDVIELLNVPPNKVSTVHLAANPIYQKEFQATEVEKTISKYGLSRGFVLFVGTLEPRKNLPMLIRAYAQLRQESQIKAPLILVGKKGWIYEDIFSTIEELNITKYVRHMPEIFDTELAHFYHAAGVLVTPSHYEGFGLPALEAQHCGCPVVVSNRGSLPEIVGPEGVLLAPDDMQGWVDTLIRVLIDNDYRKEMIKTGREQATKFSWEKTAREMISIYTDNE